MASKLMGIFPYEDEFLDAARQLKEAGFDRLTLMTPIPLHEIDEILETPPSPVRRFSLIGALLGAMSGFALAAATALVFILPTGGRPIIPFPPYLVITYEMTILLGVLATLLGFHVVSGLPAWQDAPYTPETNVDRFSVLVSCGETQDPDKAQQIMQDAGAEEVREVEEE